MGEALVGCEACLPLGPPWTRQGTGEIRKVPGPRRGFKTLAEGSTSGHKKENNRSLHVLKLKSTR